MLASTALNQVQAGTGNVHSPHTPALDYQRNSAQQQQSGMVSTLLSDWQ